MNDKFLPELVRRLRHEGIATGEIADSRLPVLLDGQESMWVNQMGAIYLNSKTADKEDCIKLYDQVAELSAQVREYTAAIEAAPRLKVDGLHEKFRLLSEFNGLVLAGREMGDGLGYEFATWWYTYDRTGVTQGNYHYDYDNAKLDFACRSGLVEKHRQFTDEQLVEVYRCIHETLDGEYPITEERRKTLTAAAEQIEYSVDDLAEQVEQSNQRELEAADGQADSGLGWEMSP